MVETLYKETHMKYILSFCLLLLSTQVQGAYLLKNGRLINTKYIATHSVEDHFELGMKALKAHNWSAAEDQFHIVITNFADYSLANDAHYYLGVTLYEENEFDLANEHFSSYLLKSNTPTHLEDLYRYKLDIAMRLASGCRRRMFGSPSMPKIMNGSDLAVEIFDEIAAGLPNHELAGTALIEKGKLLTREEEYEQAIDTYHTTIRRFRGSRFALNAFHGISTCYFEELKKQPQNSDALVLAEINLRELKKEFPQAEELSLLEDEYRSMQELYVDALYQTGQLYERMSQPKASILYYHLAATTLPSYHVAHLCKNRMKDLAQYVEELHLSIPA